MRPAPSRRREKAEALRGEGIVATSSTGKPPIPRSTSRLAAADCLLVSIPPDAAGDPVLRPFRRRDRAGAAARAHHLSLDDRRLRRPCRPLGRRDDRAAPGQRAQPRKARRRSRPGRPSPPAPARACTSCGSPASTAPARMPSSPCATARPGGSSSRARCSIASMSRISRVRSRRPALMPAKAPSGTSPTTNRRRPQDVVAYAAALLGIAPPPEIPFDAAELSPMARSFYGESKRVANAALKERLGVELAFPTYREGLRQPVRDGGGALAQLRASCSSCLRGDRRTTKAQRTRRRQAASCTSARRRNARCSGPEWRRPA